MTNLEFNSVELTSETIQNTRRWFSDNALACIEEAKRGKSYINDLEYYIELENKNYSDYLEGKYDHTLTFLQRAYYIQTGQSLALINW